MFRRLALSFAAVAALCAGGQTVHAATYPAQPVKLIIPYNAGGGVDQLCRIIEQDFKKLSGQSLTFIYKPGASGATGITEFSKMRPDGYAIAAQSYPQLLTNQLRGNGRYTIEDFDYLCMVGFEPAVFVVRAESPFKTFQEFMEAAKAKPYTLSVGLGDILGPSHFGAMALADHGMKVNTVPFAGGPKANPQLLGGHIDALMATFGTVAPAINKMRPLAVTGEKRSKAYPEVPTFRELGYDDVVFVAGRTFMAPKGLKKDVHDKLTDVFRQIYTQPDIQERYDETGLEIQFTDGPTLKKMYAGQEAVLKKFIKQYEEEQKRQDEAAQQKK